ncbi:hypothetical protein EI969_15955 [Pseudomonas sp. PB101]|nr:hypothetical protein [Pseudomonas sp. PB101]
MGASLLAMAVDQSTLMLNDMASSRASSLLQGDCVYRWIKPPADPVPGLRPSAGTCTASVSTRHRCPGC